MADNLELLNLRLAQQGQIIEQYRASMYNSELKTDLILKMLEEKGIFVKSEFEKRWPLFLRNDVGVVEQDGLMAGSLKVHFWGGN